MKLPSTFIETIQGAYGERGCLYLNALPTLVDEAVQRWQLRELQPAGELSYSFIAYARRDDVQVVLKIAVPDRELTSQVRSLRLFSGRGTVRLLESDSGRGMLLLERLLPGETLASLSDDAQATRVAAQVMLALRREVPPEQGLLQLADWFGGLARLRRNLGGTGPLDPALYARAEACAVDLLAENLQPALIHGDLHHFNILTSQRGWLAIDPKGIVGPAACEVGPFLFNPWVVRGIPHDAVALLRRRIEILSDALAIEKQRIVKWGLAHALLSAVWSIEDKQDWRVTMECARLLDALTF